MQGKKGDDIAAILGSSRAMVLRWQARYKALGLPGLLAIQPGRGRKPLYTQERVHEVVTKTATTRPDGSAHWSTRTMAKATGISHATIGRIWYEHGLKPHQVWTFKISNDKKSLTSSTAGTARTRPGPPALRWP